jgi:hypothetical protein
VCTQEFDPHSPGAFPYCREKLSVRVAAIQKRPSVNGFLRHPRGMLEKVAANPDKLLPRQGIDLKKQPTETREVESLKEIGRRLARFPLKVDS